MRNLFRMSSATMLGRFLQRWWDGRHLSYETRTHKDRRGFEETHKTACITVQQEREMDNVTKNFADQLHLQRGIGE